MINTFCCKNCKTFNQNNISIFAEGHLRNTKRIKFNQKLTIQHCVDEIKANLNSGCCIFNSVIQTVENFAKTHKIYLIEVEWEYTNIAIYFKTRPNFGMIAYGIDGLTGDMSIINMGFERIDPQYLREKRNDQTDEYDLDENYTAFPHDDESYNDEDYDSNNN